MVLFLLLMLVAEAASRLPTLPVRTSNGLVKGSVALDESYLRYNGIPYAVAPERFQASKSPPPWRGVLDATKLHYRCPQKMPKPFITGDEDCLYLNVYTPIKPKSYPVMVYIHGGGFKKGSGTPMVYGPEYLVRQDVVVVTFNYRLDLLGFLCLGIKEAPGNVGLKDQVLALRWVKDNIKAFGGDPDNITIFGESAGSASVNFHLLSPMSKGLFHRAIMESGSSISYWAFQFEPKEIAYKKAAVMGYNTTDVNEIVNIFKQKTPAELLGPDVPRPRGDINQAENIFVPCIEEPIEGSEAFLLDSPFNIMTKDEFNKVPLIMGFNSVEGYLFVGRENATTISEFNFRSALPRDLTFPSEAERESTAARLEELYAGENQSISVQSLVKYEGDTGIKYPVIATIDLFLKFNSEPVYGYNFAYSGLLNLVKIGSGFATRPGASHADELLYLFKPEGTAVLAVKEMNMINKMTTMWTNFAKYGEPIPKTTPLLPQNWDPTNLTDPHIFVIDEPFSTQRLWEDEDILYWNETYTYYRRTN